MKASAKVSADRKTGGADRYRAESPKGSELAAISRTVDRLMNDSVALRRVMKKAGIITKAGKLAKEYQS